MKETPPPNSENIQVSVVIPCLDEAETIGGLIKKILNNIHPSFEIIVADNGSTDGTLELLKEFPVRVVSVPNKGYGEALKAGIEAAKGKYIVMGDGDDSYELENFQRFVVPLENGCEMVIGNRFSGNIQAGAMPWLHKYLGNPLLSFIGRKLFRIKIGDFHCGIRSFTKTSVRRLKLNSAGMEFATEMIAKAALCGLKVVEIPTNLRKDGRTRPPHLHTWRDGWRHLKFMLVYSPEFLLMYPSFFFFLSGCCILIFDAFAEISTIGRPHNMFGTVVGIFLIVLATFLLFLALIMQVILSRTLGFRFSRKIAYVNDLLNSKPTKYILISVQLVVTIWFGSILSLWINNDMTFSLDFQRMKYGLIFLTVTSVNFIYFIYTLISYFLEKELVYPLLKYER